MALKHCSECRATLKPQLVGRPRLYCDARCRRRREGRRRKEARWLRWAAAWQEAAAVPTNPRSAEEHVAIATRIREQAGQLLRGEPVDEHWRLIDDNTGF